MGREHAHSASHSHLQLLNKLKKNSGHLHRTLGISSTARVFADHTYLGGLV